jgi:hypothetical protein
VAAVDHPCFEVEGAAGSTFAPVELLLADKWAEVPQVRLQ